MSLAMTEDECETFLAGAHVAVMSVQREGRGPLSMPVWYAYDPGGEVRIWAGGNSTKVRLVKRVGRFTVCVQRATPPYKFVSVEGPMVAIEPIDFERDLRPLVYRYLDREEGDHYLEELGGSAALKEDVLIRMSPDRWFSQDHSKEGGAE